jgi:hypothetical protein
MYVITYVFCGGRAECWAEVDSFRVDVCRSKEMKATTKKTKQPGYSVPKFIHVVRLLSAPFTIHLSPEAGCASDSDGDSDGDRR